MSCVTESASELIIFSYEFLLSDDRRWSYQVRLDPLTLKQVHEAPTIPLPEWTRLEVSQCTNCPLSPESTPHCPVAVSIDEMVEFFADSYAHEEARVTPYTQKSAVTKKCAHCRSALVRCLVS